MNIEYYIVNPCGNITALAVTNVPPEKYGIIAKKIMETEKSVEQVGFVDFSNNCISLRMAGDEFCGNATISAAVLYCELKNKTGTVLVGIYGCKNKIQVDVKKVEDGFLCDGYFEKSSNIEEKEFCYNGKKFKGTFVKKEGISHIVTTDLKEEKFAEEFIKYYCKKSGERALGIMLLGEKNTLTPIVYVKNVDTLFYENSCASGGCAVAESLLTKNNEKLELLEPGGAVLLENADKYIKLSEKVIIERKEIKGDLFEL